MLAIERPSQGAVMRPGVTPPSGIARAAIASLLAIGCTQGGTTAVSPTPAAGATRAAESLPLSASPTVAATETGAPSASAPADLAADLMSPGQLTICSAFPRSRAAERDATGKPFGADIDLGLAIAEHVALEPVITEVPFEELIDAIVDRRCDVAISGHFITQERLERIAMVPYREGAVNVVVEVDNPLGIEALTDLCGRTVAIVTGTIYHDIVLGLGDYAGEGLNEQCTEAGAPPVNLAESTTEDDAVAEFDAGDADAFIGNEAVALDSPGQYELSTAELPRLRNGIGLRLASDTLEEAIRAALRALIADGTYARIMDRYGFSTQLTELP